MQEALLGDVIRRTSQTRQVDEDGGRTGLRGRRREEEGEVHVGASGLGLVGELEETATKGSDGCVCGECHGELKKKIELGAKKELKNKYSSFC